MRKILLLAGALALAPLAAGAAEPEKITMAIAARSMNYAPYFIPIAKSYFKEEGFEVELVEAGGGVATPAQISGKIDFNTSGSAALSAMLKGAALKIIYFPWDRIPYQIYTSDPSIKTIQDLKGKSIGIQTRGDTFEVAMRTALVQEGMDSNAVGYTALGFGTARRAALASGSLPAVIISPIDANWLRGAGQLHDARMIYDLGKNVQLPLTGTAVRTADLEKNPDRVKRLLRAVSKGMLYTAAYRDASVDIVLGFNKGGDRNAILETYDETIAGRTPDGSISEKLQHQETNMRAELVKLPKDKIPPLDKLYDFSLTKEVAQELEAQGWKPTK